MVSGWAPASRGKAAPEAASCVFSSILQKLNSLDDFALKLLGTPPLADTFQTVTVATVGQDAEAALTWVGLFKHHLHADATHHVLTALDGKGDLHVFLMGFDAGLQEKPQHCRSPGTPNLHCLTATVTI